MSNASEARKTAASDSGNAEPSPAAAAQTDRGNMPAPRTGGAAAEVIRDMTRRVADQGQEAVRIGLHAVAGAHEPLVDAGYNQTRRLVETTARITDICHDAAQRTAEDVQALTGSCYSFGRGLQKYQHVYLDLVSRSMDSVSRKRQGLSRVNSPVEFAEIQRDIYLDSLNSMFTGCTTLLQIAAQISQDALRPLQERERARAK